MIFGRIDYLNLLPFSLFLKRRYPFLLTRSRRHKGPPSHINRLFMRRQIDAAFISSIRSRGQKGTNIGIVARGEVMSVLLLPSDVRQNDSESETSNELARILGLQGRVLIGDKALRHRLSGQKGTDLALEWHRQSGGLPFVFARLCYNSHGPLVHKIAKEFAASAKIRIPTYIKKREAARCQIPQEAIEHYLAKIHYKIDIKAARGLKRFLDAGKEQEYDA